MSQFSRIPGSKTAGSRIQAVKLEWQFNDETVDVWVTLLRGEKGFDQEDLVGVYHLVVALEPILEKVHWRVRN